MAPIIGLKTPEMAASVFAPKVTGTLVLDRLLKNVPLDFFVLFSSLSAIVGGLGQADYCGANAFLDKFASIRERAVAINWDAWQETGMAAKVLPMLANFHQGLSATEGIEAFDRILQRNLSRVIVTPTDLSLLIQRYRELAPEVNLSTSVFPRPHLRNAYIAPRNEIEAAIANIWQEILGIDRVGVEDNFFELGGHSLLATQINSRLQETLATQLPIRELFELQTVASLAAKIANATPENTALPAAKNILPVSRSAYRAKAK